MIEKEFDARLQKVLARAFAIGVSMGIRFALEKPVSAKQMTETEIKELSERTFLDELQRLIE